MRPEDIVHESEAVDLDGLVERHRDQEAMTGMTAAGDTDQAPLCVACGLPCQGGVVPHPVRPGVWLCGDERACATAFSPSKEL